MGFLLFVSAAAALLSAGFGLAVLVTRGRGEIRVGELVALSVLVGSLFVTLGWWGVALFAPDRWAVAVVTPACFALGILGGVILRRTKPRLAGLALFAGFGLPIAAWIGWMAARSPFEWDGLFVWEMKAQALMAGEGPHWSYFHDPSRSWSHPSYPLLVPVLRVWFYNWLGGPHEAYGKLSGTLFPLAAAGLLLGPLRHFGRGMSLCAFALFVTTPLTVTGAGSATSGYADYPLAVFYFGAVVFLLRSREGTPGDLVLAAVLAAALPWIKQEGAVLFATCLVLAVFALGLANWRRLLILATPGVAVLLMWRLFQGVEAVESDRVFDTPVPGLLLEKLSLLDDVLGSCLRISANIHDWGFLWLLVPVAVAAGLGPRQRRETLLLATSVAAPVCLLASAYLFTRWQPMTEHVLYSFPRVLLQVSLPAIWLVAARTASALSALRGARSLAR